MSGGNNPAVYGRAELDVLKRAVDLPTLIQEHGVALRRVGKSLLGRCFLHDDEEESFSVNLGADPPMWKCFGCNQGGDAIRFLETREGWTFQQAVEHLRTQAGAVDAGQLAAVRERVARGPLSPEDADRLAGGLSRPELLERVADFYHRRLGDAPDARTYLRGRKLGVTELLDSFALGYCDGHSLLKTLPDAGEMREALTQLGMINESGREHFAGCIVVPLEHPDLGIVGMYGRKIAPNARVKHLYLRGPQRGVLNWQALQSSREVFVAESVLDALSIWVAGERNVTCLYGASAMHRDLLDALGRYAVREVRFCLDADRAGQAATVRLTGELGARGVRCFQVDLPTGQDPNQVLCEKGTAVLRDMLAHWRVAPTAEDGKTEAPSVEPDAEGFVLRFGELVYRVKPIPPFSGKMRVMLRLVWRDRSFLDNFDLSGHRARQMGAGHIQRALGLARVDVERHLMAIAEETERWILTLNQAAVEEETARKAPPEMSESEREEALAFLRRGDLTDTILADMEALGYVGEEQGKLLAYLIGISRKLDHPLAGVIISQSGAGKSSLTDLIEVLTPPEEVVAYARISTQALMYEEKDFLKRKLLILEERVGAEQADYSIRVLQSKQKLSQASVTKNPNTGQMYTKHYEVEGPVSYLETTTNPRINYENATRCFELSIDESIDQTQRIHARQREARTPRGLLRRMQSDAIRRRHHNAQRLLQRVHVVIPYVEQLSFPSRWLRTRRDNERFLCLIEAVAFLHQYSRPRRVMTLEDQALTFIEATPDDYRQAYDLARQVLGVTLHELSRSAQEILEIVRQMVGEMTERKEAVHFTRRDVRQYSGWHDHRVRDALQELVDMEYVLVVRGTQGQTFQYRLVQGGGGDALPLYELTTPEQLEAMLTPKS